MAISGMKSDAGRVGIELVEAFEQAFSLEGAAGGQGWVRLIQALERVSEVGERNGLREISIQAQCLRATVECCAKSSRGAFVAGGLLISSDAGIEGWIERLKEHLDHLAWTKEVSALPEMV